MRISTNEPLKKMLKADTVDEVEAPLKDHNGNYPSSLEKKKKESLTECINEDSEKPKDTEDNLPQNDIRFIDSKINAAESKSSSIEFEELEDSNVTENRSNIAAVMQTYSVMGEETVPSFMDYHAGMEGGSSDDYSDDDSNDEDSELPSTSSGPSLQLFTKEACKVMLQMDSSDDDDGQYNDIDKKILKFQENKNGLDNNTPAAVNIKDSESAQYDDNNSETSETTNTTIGGLIDIYNENESSCPTFMDYNIMEDFMTQSSDDND